MPPSRFPRTVALAAALAIALGACGSDGEDRLEEDSLRECPAGVEVDVIVTESDRAAKRSAADVRAALLSFGVADAEILSERNAVVVIAGETTAAERGAIEDC